MADSSKSESELGVAPLVSGILNDAQLLFSQQLTLFKHELEGEIGKIKGAAISLAVGAGILAVGVILVLFMAVHLLHQYTPIPLWGCYGITGGVLLGAGAILYFVGRSKASHVNLMAPPQATAAMKENFQWLKNQAIS